MKKLLQFLLAFLFTQTLVAQAIVSDTFSLFDKARNRDIPVRIYRPQQLTGSYPIVIFSHGLGGSVNAAAYLGKALAEHGYICFFIQHHGSDEQVWKGLGPLKAATALKESVLVPANFINRAEDLPFVVAQLSVLNESDVVLKAHLDLEHIGMAGHSYGGRSVMIAAGEKLGGRVTKFAEPAIKAALVLSPNTPEKIMGDTASIYSSISIPLFHMTGTKDDYPLDKTGNFDPIQRTIPFRKINTSPQYLLVLSEATHGTFGGLNRPLKGKAISSHLDAITSGAIAFFDGYLKNNREQLNWLQNKYAPTLSADDMFEFKMPPGM